MLMGHNADDFVEYYYMQKSKKSKPLFYGIKWFFISDIIYY
jgi:hypothetical protein